MTGESGPIATMYRSARTLPQVQLVFAGVRDSTLTSIGLARAIVAVEDSTAVFRGTPAAPSEASSTPIRGIGRLGRMPFVEHPGLAYIQRCTT